jgi:hypothetical protein
MDRNGDDFPFAGFPENVVTAFDPLELPPCFLKLAAKLLARNGLHIPTSRTSTSGSGELPSYFKTS